MRTLTLVGAGPVGVEAARAALNDGIIDTVAVVVDPDVEAREAATAMFNSPGCGDIPGCAGLSEVALVAFSSRLGPTLETIEALIGRGVNVVSTCEELARPPNGIRVELDEAARAAQRVVIATGANPGFVMDRLPLVIAGAVRNISRIHVTRRVDTSRRRGPLVSKTGRGLTVAEFERRVGKGTVGHVGLEDSARLVVDGLDWVLDRERSTIEPVVVDGVVSGVHQTFAAEAEGGRSLLYDLAMAWEITEPGDVIDVDGATRVVVQIPGGYHGDLGTTARAVRGLLAVERLHPGFYRPTDLPLAW